MKHFSFVLICIVFFQGFLFAQNKNTQPRLEPDHAAFEFAQMGQDRNYSWQELLDMALWASGAEYSKGNTIRDSIVAAVEKLAKSAELPRDKNMQGEYLLDYMHKTFLMRYSLNQTKLDLLVSTGRFNCVSSAVLYSILASSIGLETNGVLTKDHAFIQVHVGTELIDVETTNVYGYNPGIKKEFHDGFGNTTGFAYVAPGNYRGRSSISQLELVSLILSNRIADLELRGFYNEAVGIAVDKAALLSMRTNPSESVFFNNPQQDVMDRIFNYGASLVQSGKETEALAWADIAEISYPSERWQDFIFTAMNNQLVKLVQVKKITDARILLDTNANRLTSENYSNLEMLVSDAELVQMMESVSTAEEMEQALQKIDQIERLKLFPDKRIWEFRSFILLKEAEQYAKNSGWQNAITFLENAIETYGTQSNLQNALKVYKNNKAIDLHNQFAALFNARNYEEALELVQNALQEFPGNRQLTSDLRTVENVLK
jgi:tetratricopeptide (TPR) repeat protein